MTKTFRDLGVDGALCDALEAQGIIHPFPIQELTLPLALQGHDLIGQARTGTGKTLAFGLPLLQRVDPRLPHTQALVVVPTRELCLQVYADLSIGADRGLTSISVYGGVGYDEQTDALTKGAHVVVGTPGRLLDLLNRRILDLSKVTQLVLDEADEMLDMGFLPDVERLIEACQGTDRHTMLFSATMPTAIVKLARRYMDHPTFTRADHEQKETDPNVTQYFFQVHRMDKPRLLARILQDENRGGVYVFVRTKHMADRLVNDLEDLSIPAIAIHGDLRQQTREKNLDRFRSGKATVLVCTEVAARGLDVSGVTHVVNYDCPDDEKMYLHRIGRTARAGEAGVAVTFAEFNEVDRLNVIRKKVGATDAEIHQIFSTSPVLRELFTLPDATPWDDLGRTSGGSDRGSGGRDRGGRGAGDRGGRGAGDRGGRGAGDRGKSQGRRGGTERAPAGDRTTAATDGPADDTTATDATDAPTSGGATGGASGRSRGRTASTDGRPKSGRASEGRGGAHDADRDRGRRERTADEPAATRGRARRSGRDERTTDDGTTVDTDGGTARTDDAQRSEQRTRSRTRTRTAATDAAAAATTTTGAGRSRARRDGERTSDGGREASGRDEERSRATVDQAEEQPAQAGARQRARARGGAGDRQRGRAGGDTRDRGEDGGTGSRQRDASDGRRREDAREDTERSERGSGRERGERGGGRERGGSGGRSSRNNGGSSRSGRGGAGRGGADRGGKDDDPTVRVAARGSDARGDGQPQLARRVRVEHLP